MLTHRAPEATLTAVVVDRSKLKLGAKARVVRPAEPREGGLSESFSGLSPRPKQAQRRLVEAVHVHRTGAPGPPAAERPAGAFGRDEEVVAFVPRDSPVIPWSSFLTTHTR